MSFLSAILNIIFPASCLSCGKPGTDLCNSCLSTFPGAERECAKWIYPLFDYRHIQVKKSIHLLKYKNRKPLARIFAEVIYEKILEEISELSLLENFTDPILIPIPLSRERLRERGFNQSELVAATLEEVDRARRGINLKLENNILIKKNDTRHQAHIENRTERLKNIIGSFAVKNPDRIKNKNIILIDDVITTGATLSEAKKILKESGARQVIAFTVAH